MVMTKAELLADGVRLGVEVNSRMTVAEIREAFAAAGYEEIGDVEDNEPVEAVRCERCTVPTGAQEYTLTKIAGDVKPTVLCDTCAELTAQTEGFDLKPVGRKSARASSTDEDGSPAAETSTSRKHKED